ncbi:MAG: F0F1 ATP synthase subunit A [Planctomycetales bacterium]|nr:F0F1 ATP synthase subunit A [Planctomycetales bacterium]
MSSDPLLHVKDTYYFDVPKRLWPVDYESPQQLADEVGEWTVRNNADYQEWEADRFIQELRTLVTDQHALDGAKAAWLGWQHEEPKLRHGRPFDQYVEDAVADLQSTAKQWAKGLEEPRSDAAQAYLSEFPDAQLQWMLLLKDGDSASAWQAVREKMDSREVLDEYISSPRGHWSSATLDDYNSHLSGKIFIPQPFATLKNAYEAQSGFALSRFMVIEIVVAILLFVAFRWLASKVIHGQAPKGKLWNLLESFLMFLKTDVVEKGIDPHDSKKFLPLLWTIFMFILGCNLMGMLPWVGSPTASLAVTAGLALVVFIVGTAVGIKHFGLLGYLKNLCPDLGLPMYLAIPIVPMVWVIEFLSLFIKHAILAIRLLANMVAGHLVLLGIMGLAFGAHAATMHAGSWTALSVVVILGTTILSIMELFVAFLQAYVFTLLASLFIGAASSHH